MKKASAVRKTVKIKDVQRKANRYIKTIKTEQLNNPYLLDTLRMYWAGQWDGLQKFLHSIGIETETRL